MSIILIFIRDMLSLTGIIILYMRIYSIVFLSCLALFPIRGFTIESQCFTHYSEFSQSGSSPIFVVTDERNDLFFTSENQIIPSKNKPFVMRSDFKYLLESDISEISQSSMSILTDDIVTSQIQVDPIIIPDGFSLTLNFDQILEKNTFIPRIEITSMVSPVIEIALDKKKFVPVKQSELQNYAFKYLRISFPKVPWPQSSIILHTIRFDAKQRSTYIVEAKKPWSIIAYYGWICDRTKLSYLLSQRTALGSNISVSQEITDSIEIDFSSIPTTGRDSDTDGIIDMKDNCPFVSNANQEDRDYDGRWDACTDDDNDGIIGSSDNCPTVSNKDQKDLNANSIGDTCEFDSDKDEIPDGADNCIRTSNPNQEDADSDGIGNACDNCRIYNPDQLDLNKLNGGDVCEAFDEYNKKNDSDGDTILNFSDNCIDVVNQNQEDTDTDGIGNACDNCVSIKNPNQKDENKNQKGDMCEDIDNDGIDWWRDNCPTIHNPDQEDSNNDEKWNACSDTDYDGVFDGVDNCPLLSNKDQKDIDKDSIGNICDDIDNRMLESNKTLFMVLFWCISLLFIGGIIYFIKKIKL